MTQSEKTEIGAAQGQGARDYQEDDYGISVLNRDEFFLALADGMGGHVGGAAASSISIKTAVDNFEDIDGDQTSRLMQCIHLSNDAVANEIAQSPKLDGMGCTLVVAAVQGNKLYYASVGDSPFWIWRHGDMLRVNADHSMVPVLMDLVEAGRMTEEEAAVDSRRNSLRSAIMGEDISLLDANDAAIELDADDILILASDGLETLSLSEISQIVGRNRSDMEALAAKLLREVDRRDSPNQDNVTIICARAPTDSHRSGGLYSKGSSQNNVTTMRLPRVERNAAASPSDQLSSSATKKNSAAMRYIVILLLLLALLIASFFILQKMSPQIDESDTPDDVVADEIPQIDAPITNDEPDESTPSEPSAERAFSDALESQRIQEFGLFAREYPDSPRLPEADRRAWQSARLQNTINAFEAYLRFFPNGEYAERARESVARLQSERGNQSPEATSENEVDEADATSIDPQTDTDNDAMTRDLEKKTNRFQDGTEEPNESLKDGLGDLGSDKTNDDETNDPKDEDVIDEEFGDAVPIENFDVLEDPNRLAEELDEFFPPREQRDDPDE